MWQLQPVPTDNVENWGYFNSAFSNEDCKNIIKLGESLLPDTASTFGGHQPTVRDSKVSWIYPSKDSEWLYRTMTDYVNILNYNLFKFELNGFAEGLQFTKYEAPAGKYETHMDKTLGSHIRKLSVVVQLSNPDDYDGGELCIHLSHDSLVMDKKQGNLVVFPSYVLHGVKPVTRGTRYSLVAWITGPAFK